MFTVLERSSLAVVRANAIIALGDLTVRFPNILEPWTQNLYARLVKRCSDVIFLIGSPPGRGSDTSSLLLSFQFIF